MTHHLEHWEWCGGWDVVGMTCGGIVVGGWTGGGMCCGGWLDGRRDVLWYNDFDIISTYISALASTNAVTAVPCRVA